MGDVKRPKSNWRFSSGGIHTTAWEATAEQRERAFVTIRAGEQIQQNEGAIRGRHHRVELLDRLGGGTRARVWSSKVTIAGSALERSNN